MKTPYRFSENNIIQLIKQHYPPNDQNIAAIGDDMALLDQNFDLIASDAAIENCHFNLDFMTPADAAYRTLTANLSDVAAMAAIPGHYTLTLAIPPKITINQIDDLLAALKQCTQDHNLNNCKLVGGDTVASENHLFMAITILAKTINKNFAARNTASPGDKIGIIGKTGLAAAGLELLKSNKQNLHPEIVEAFLRPKAKIEIAKKLIQNNLITSMMDISDALIDDLPKLMLASECGAKIEINHLYIHEKLLAAVNTLSTESPRTPLDYALAGGEDYALLVTYKPESFDQINKIAYHAGEPCQTIGECTINNKIKFYKEGKNFRPQCAPYYHFLTNS